MNITLDYLMEQKKALEAKRFREMEAINQTTGALVVIDGLIRKALKERDEAPAVPPAEVANGAELEH